MVSEEDTVEDFIAKRKSKDYDTPVEIATQRERLAIPPKYNWRDEGLTK